MIGMRTTLALVLTASVLAALAGCTTGGNPTPPPTSTPTPTASAATTLDPCQLVTAAEASVIAGVTFGPGLEETTGSNGTGKRCTYGAQTKNVFFVQVGSAASASAAQAAWATEEAEVDANLASGFGGANIQVVKTDLTGYGDKAAVGTGSAVLDGQTISGGDFYLLKGPNFLAFGDLTLGTPPTAEALEAQATISLGRMP